MISSYLNQAATWYKKTGQDGYGKSTYDAGTVIKVRWEPRVRLIRDKAGKEIAAEARVFCQEAVAVDDQLAYGGTTRTVLLSTEVVGLNGQVSHREVYV